MVRLLRRDGAEVDEYQCLVEKQRNTFLIYQKLNSVKQALWLLGPGSTGSKIISANVQVLSKIFQSWTTGSIRREERIENVCTRNCHVQTFRGKWQQVLLVIFSVATMLIAAEVLSVMKVAVILLILGMGVEAAPTERGKETEEITGNSSWFWCSSWIETVWSVDEFRVSGVNKL